MKNAFFTFCFSFGLIVFFNCALFPQERETSKPYALMLKMEFPLEATGLSVGGVKEFPAGLYRMLRTNQDGIFYIYERHLVAELIADTVYVQGGLFIPKDSEDDIRGWYSMPRSPFPWKFTSLSDKPKLIPVPTIEDNIKK